MATAIDVTNGALNLISRLETILKVDHATGYDLSGEDQYKVGNHDHPVGLGGQSFVAMRFPLIKSSNESGRQPLTRYTQDVECVWEGWQPVLGGGDELPQRLIYASLLWSYCWAAIQADHAADGGAGSLFRLLHNVPKMEGHLLEESAYTGTTYARFLMRVTFELRPTAGI